MKGLQCKNVLVTGGSSGIGQAIAIRFAEEGSNVSLNYRSSSEAAQRTKEEMEKLCVGKIRACGVNHLLVQGDVSNEDDAVRIIHETIGSLGGLDVLINNAGIQFSGSSHEIEMQKFDKVLAVNLRGAYICAREAITHFLNEGKKGVIINISSVHQLIPKPQYIGYSVSKGGMQNLTRTLALEYAGRGIRVNAIGPGATVTPINRAWIDNPEKRAEVVKHIPMGRAGTSDEMAAVAAFLASDEADYITGQTIFVDGGLTLYPDFRSTWSTD